MKKNEGFSLVELIVVIAIMAILVGILAPVYLKYVEKSRKSTDTHAMDELFDAAEVVATDREYYVPVGTQFAVTSNGNGYMYYTIPKWGNATTKAGCSDAAMWTTVEDDWKDTANKGDPYNIKSKAWRSMTGSMYGEVMSDGSVKWFIGTGDAIFTSMCEYSESMQKVFENYTPVNN